MITMNSVIDILPQAPAKMDGGAELTEGFSEEMSKATDQVNARGDGKPDKPQKADQTQKSDKPQEEADQKSETVEDKIEPEPEQEVSLPFAGIQPVQDVAAETPAAEQTAASAQYTVSDVFMTPPQEAMPEEKTQQPSALPEETSAKATDDQDAASFVKQAMQEANALLENSKQPQEKALPRPIEPNQPEEVQKNQAIVSAGEEKPAQTAEQTTVKDVTFEAREHAGDPKEKDAGKQSVTRHSPMTAQVTSEGKVEFKLSSAQLENLEQPQSKENVLTRVIDQVKSTVSKEKTEFFLQLKPEHLGGLSILLSAEEKGVAAKLMTSNHDVQQVLQSDLNQLQAALREKGINVVHMEVIYDQTASSTARDNRDGGRQQGNAFARAHGRAIEGVEEAAAFYDSLSYYDVLAEQGGSVEFSA